ncbi:MAG: Rieske (2Fe-2S) protein [Candidatus Hydrogenedentes bacterium]|nr:Rieske (2Fe-2S) protein [Candidatus Hydrogenedentota bacterium]
MPVYPACPASALQENSGIHVVCDGKEIALFKMEGRYFACSNRCPHAGARLSEGFLSGTVVTCPWHGWSFDMNPGETPPRDGVLRYEVIEENGELKVVLPG